MAWRITALVVGAVLGLLRGRVGKISLPHRRRGQARSYTGYVSRSGPLPKAFPAVTGHAVLQVGHAVLRVEAGVVS